MKGNGFNVMLNAKAVVEHERRLSKSYSGGISIDYDHPTMKQAVLTGLIPMPASDRSEKIRDTPFKLVRCRCDDDGVLVHTESRGIVKQEANSAALLPTRLEIDEVHGITSAPWIANAVDQVVARHRKDDAPITADNVQAVRDSRIDTSPKAEQVSEADLIDAPQEPVRKRPAVRKQAAPPVERKNRKLSAILRGVK